MPTSIVSPRLLLIGGGVVREIAAVMKKFGLTHPLIVTDPFMVSSGLIRRALDALEEAAIPFTVFSDTVPEPIDTVVETGTKLLQTGKFDCLIGFGGGSPIDTAKAMAILFAGGGQMRDYKVPAQVDFPALPIIAIPTTAGTGSETTRFTVITDTKHNEKMLIAGLAALPLAALVDHELTFTVPPRTTADTGIDALTHALEAYVSRRANPYSDAQALAALRLIGANLRTAYREPHNAHAREAMMLGATLAGLAFGNSSVALVHGMSRPIGAHFHVPHGLSNAMLLPTVTRYSLPAAVVRYAEAARAIGFAGSEDPDEVAAEKLAEGLAQLNRDLAVPGPAEYGIDPRTWEERLPVMAEQALASGSPANNPRVPDAAEIITLYRMVWASSRNQG
jgi:alcohol dehydrogenase class IV